MFDRLNQHPVIVCIAILGSVASIVGLVFGFFTHNVGSSRDDPNPAVTAANGKSDLVTTEPRDRDGPDPLPPVVHRKETPWTLVQTLAGHEHMVTAVAFEKDGQRLVSGSLDGTLRIWKVSTGECLGKLSTDRVPYGTDASVNSVDVSPRDALIVSGHGRVFRLWDIETSDNIRSFEDPGKTYWSVAFSPDGDLLAAASSDGVDLMEVETKSVREVDAGQIASVAFSPDGSQFATAGWNGTVTVWNVESVDVPRRTIPDTRNLTSVAFSPDGAHVAAAGKGSVIVWDATTGKSVHSLRSPNATHGFNSVAYCPTRPLVAAGGKGGVVRIWDTQTGEELQSLNVEVVGPGRYVHSIRFDPDGSRLAVGCGDGSILIWTTEELHDN